MFGREKLSRPFAVLHAACLIFAAGGPGLCASGAGYERADAAALAAGPGQAVSVSALAAALCRGLETEDERARAIFRWIAGNVDYSRDAGASGAAASGPEGVLRTRRAACEGYASLFASLARACGLQAEVIGGYSKGYRYRAGAPLPLQPDHAWNAVMIGGRWRLVDCTWGAGYLDESGRFRCFLNDHYFLTPPEEFIYDHFPEEPRWQLLDRPLSREQYQELLMVRPGFFRYGLRAISHRQARVVLDGAGEISLEVPEAVALLARLYSGEAEAAGSPVFVRRGTGATVLVSPPAKGTYRLRLFAKNRDENGPYEWVAEYIVQAGAAGEPPSYPRPCEAYYARAVILERPLQGRLTAGREVDFRLRVPGASQVAVVSGDDWTFLREKDGWHVGSAMPARGPVQVAAGFPGSDSFEVLLTYDVE